MSVGNLAQIREAARHVLEPGLVGLVVRDELDRGGRPAQLAHPLGELADRDLLGVADVDDLADRLGLGDQLEERADDVARRA